MPLTVQLVKAQHRCLSLLRSLAWIILRKSKKANRIFGCLFAAPLSYVLGHLMITARFASFSATNDFIMNCMAAVAIYGVLVFGASLLKQRKQDMIAE